MNSRRGWSVWAVPAILAAFAGCGKPLHVNELSLDTASTATLRVPFVPTTAVPETGTIQRTAWLAEPEKLEPPKKETAKDAKDKGSEKKIDLGPAVKLLPGSRLTLEQAILLCLRSDPKLKAGFEDIAQARAELVTASLKPNPTLDVAQTLLPLFRAFKVDKQGGPPQFDLWVSYPIDWCLFGKQAAAMARDKIGIEVSEYEYANALRERVREVALAYYDLLEARSLAELTSQGVDNLKRAEATLEKAVKAGTKAVVDLNLVRLDRLKGEQALCDAESTVAVARIRLRSYLGGAESDQAFEVEGSLEGELPKGDVSIEEAFAAAQMHRPDIRAAHAAVMRSQAAVEVEESKAYPEVTTRAGYTHQFQKTTIGFPDADAWGVGVSMTLPYHNRNEGNRIKARSVVAQKQHELQARLLALRAEIEQAILEYRTAQANARAIAGDQLRLADEIRKATEQAYKAGSRSLPDLLDAQRSYRETYRLLIASRASYYRAVNRLQNATGAGVQREPHPAILGRPNLEAVGK